jgi:uncharacterized protein
LLQALEVREAMVQQVLPICGGGCSQISMENEGKEYCVKNFDENRKLQLVKNRFLNLVSTQ